MAPTQAATNIIRKVLTISAANAYGCPFCHTTTGDSVRTGTFNSSFGLHLLAVVLPFLVFAGLVAWLYFGKPVSGFEAVESKKYSATSVAQGG